jgi:nitrile hydratase subunit beta
VRGTDGIHDLGGMQGLGAVVVSGAEQAYHARWEPRVFAMSLLVGLDRLAAGSGRRVRELMPADDYLRASYYERWQWSNERRLERKGTIAEGDVDRWVERLAAGEDAPRHEDPQQAARACAAIVTAERETVSAEARFRPGDRVRVKRMRPTGHTRCPRYVRGATGLVDRLQGVARLPDDGPQRGTPHAVYAVAFRSGELFGTTDEPPWTVLLDLYEPYLEGA